MDILAKGQLRYILDLINDDIEKNGINHLRQTSRGDIDFMIKNYCLHKSFKTFSDVDYVRVCCTCGEVVDYE